MATTYKRQTTFNNIGWYLKKASKKFPRLKYGLPINVLSSLVLLVATSGVPALIVWALQRALNVSLFTMLILTICIGLGCLMWGQATYKTWLTWENANLRMQLTVDDGMGFLSSPFEDAINTSIQKQRVASARHGYEDDGSGVDVLWPNFVNLCATLSSVCVIAGLTLMITWWSPIVVLLFTGLSGVVLVRFNERQEKLKASLDESNFVQKYLYQEAFKLGAGKDIRLYHLQDQYRKKIDETYNCVIETQKKMNWQKVKSISIICLLDCFQLLLVYLPLVSRASANDMSLPTFAFLFTLLGTLSALTRKGATEFSQLMLANEDVSVGRVYLDYVDGLELQAAEGRKKLALARLPKLLLGMLAITIQIVKSRSFVM
ncbi:ABC transporter ATP-binding protein [Levilactobacillus cerevisiae]|uniref:ABC transporter ATP-binding protein n=1 Tax=Levilactobacillus cerevisiae TaxID=1704076 RepID=UPI000F7804C8|nr:ABC transporter ATP-binding protein [Levilactobacillus cerevisiae]